jgi:hypothetical protein
MRDLRILCLHGYHGDAGTMRRQIAPLASQMGANIEFVYVNAPSIAGGDYGWWHNNFAGWNRTRDWAVNLFQSQPHFDGVLGFSQGAALTGLLTGLRETYLDIPNPPISFEFAVMVGGFKSDSPQHAELFQQRFALPSVHVIGRTDTIVPSRDSKTLADQFVDPMVIEHSGGHVIPGSTDVTQPIARFLTRMSK